MGTCVSRAPEMTSMGAVGMPAPAGEPSRPCSTSDSFPKAAARSSGDFAPSKIDIRAGASPKRYSRLPSVLWMTKSWANVASTGGDCATTALNRACSRMASFVAQYAPKLRSEEHTSELQSQSNLVCRLLLEKKKLPV